LQMPVWKYAYRGTVCLDTASSHMGYLFLTPPS
jgi:hypothetical protein